MSIRRLPADHIHPDRTPAAPPTDTGQRSRTAIVVLGVSRSGTSAFTRIINLLGAALPRDVLAPGAGNERGHWEPAALVALNEEILRAHGRDWSSPEPMPPTWFTSAYARHLVERTAAVIADQYEGADLIVIKEPRLCLLGPLTFGALERLGYAPRVVLPLRHPAEVVGSVGRRDSMGACSGELLWLRHLMEAEAASRGYPRVWMPFERVLVDWRHAVRQIGRELSIRWPVDPAHAAARIDAFLEPMLRHVVVGRNVPPSIVGPLATRLWDAALDASAGDDAEAAAGFDAVRLVAQEFDRLERGRSRDKPARLDMIDDAIAAVLTVPGVYPAGVM
jgi:hypothetical protein